MKKNIVILTILLLSTCLNAGMFFKGEGVINIESLQGMALIIDGKDRGDTGTSTKLKLKEGKHTIEVKGVVSTGGLKGAILYDKRDITIGSDTEITIKMTPQIIQYPERAKIANTTKEDDLFSNNKVEDNNKKEESFEDMVKSLKSNKEKKLAEKEALLKRIKKLDADYAKDKLPKTHRRNITELPKASKGIYLQVGSTAHDTVSGRLMMDAETNGYEIKSYEAKCGTKKITKFLVGPYDTTAEAQKALPKAKELLNKNTYVYRVRD